MPYCPLTFSLWRFAAGCSGWSRGGGGGGGAGQAAATQNGDELATEVVVEPAVEDRVGAGRAECHQVTHGEDEMRQTQVTPQCSRALYD